MRISLGKLLALASLAMAGAQPLLANPFESLRTLDTRLIAVGTQLAVANAALCEDRQSQPGMTIHDLSQYGRNSRAEAAAAFGLTGHPAILALAPAGGAFRAGLLPDDNIIAVDGQALPRPPAESEAGFAFTERLIDAIEAAFADGFAELAILRAGRAFTIRVEAPIGCASRFQVLPSNRIEARADGRYVQLSSALIEATPDDDELAATVAHELAHNILRHRARLAAAGVSRGPMEGLGRNGRLLRLTEMEADRLAIHLMDRAGFDPEAAVRQRMRRGGSAGLAGSSHPDRRTRIAAMRAEIAAIAAARARGAEAVPPLPRGPLAPAGN